MTESSQLTEDAIVEILIRLSIKQIVQCKSVSKQWLRLISSPSFAFRQAQVQTFDNPAWFYILRVLFSNNCIVPVSLVGGKLVTHQNIDLPPMETESDFPMQVLFPAGYGIYCLFEIFSGNVLLWNPTVKQTKVLPPSPYFPSSVVHDYYFGTVDYKDGNFSYKVGRLSSKAIKFVHGNSRSMFSLSLELYSFETKSWKHIPDFSSCKYLGYPDYVSHCVNLNGRVHWVIQSDAGDTYISTFDYETEVFGRMKAPSPVEVGDRYDKLRFIVTLYDDKFLCLGLFRKMYGKPRYPDIWVMREYEVEDSWTKVFTVGPIAKGVKVLGFSSKLQGVFSWHKNADPTLLLLSDCETSKMKMCCMIGGRMPDQYMQVAEHVESLVSVLD